MKTLYKVYWTDLNNAVQGQEFEDLQTMLDFTHKLRSTNSARFITTVAEDPNCTNLPGAASMEIKDYHWKKRRL